MTDQNAGAVADRPTARERIEALIAEVRPGWHVSGPVENYGEGNIPAFCAYAADGPFDGSCGLPRCVQAWGRSEAAAVAVGFALLLGVDKADLADLMPVRA